jgi:hypothetical protein
VYHGVAERLYQKTLPKWGEGDAEIIGGFWSTKLKAGWQYGTR